MGELVNVADIRVGKRYRKELGDLDALVASIHNVGLISPIAVNADNVLVAGQRRLEAVKRLGWDVVEVVVVDGSQPLATEHDENVIRKDFTPSERKAITDALLEIERPRAAARMAQGGARGGRAKTSPGTGVPGLVKQREEGRADDRAAKQAGWNRTSYRRFSRIQAAYEAHPDNPAMRAIYEAVERGEIGVKTAEKRAVLAGLLESEAAEFHETPEPPHMGLAKKSPKSSAARLLKIADDLAGYAAALPTFHLEGGDADNQVLEQMLRDLSAIRHQVKRLMTGGEANVR